jgi:hypothetical protein
LEESTEVSLLRSLKPLPGKALTPAQLQRAAHCQKVGILDNRDLCQLADLSEAELELIKKALFEKLT